MIQVVVMMAQKKKNSNSNSADDSPKQDHDNNDNKNSNSNNNNSDTTSSMLDELSWRAAKLRLEEADQRKFQLRLKRKPIKLSYWEARQWVQYNLGPQTQEEFYDLVANGNLRTPYIPKQPDQYYTNTGDWISWDHFLTMDPKVAGRIVPPATGRFD